MKKRSADFERIASDIVAAALTRQFTSGDAWDYGWSVLEYRRSTGAAIQHDSKRCVSLSPEGVEAFERAMDHLSKRSDVRNLYDGKELWSIVASLIGTLPMSAPVETIERLVRGRLTDLTAPPNSVVVTPLANVDPGDLPIEAGPLLIGRLGEQWRDRLKARTRGQELISAGTKPWWESLGDGSDERAVVLLAHFGESQSSRAVIETEEAFENLIALALVLEPDLDARELFSLRGDSHRPGIRGLAVDREWLQSVAKTIPVLFRELAADVVVSGLLGTNVTHRWYGEKPFPLDELLRDERMEEARHVLIGRTSVHHRLKVAARWHAKAYWSSDVEDAVLALGIAFEALLSENNPSPGRVLGDRFAFLAPKSTERPVRYKLFTQEYYAARSSIAHGAKRSSIDAPFVRKMAKDVRDVFRTIASLTKEQKVESEDAYARMFDAMKWGAHPVVTVV